ncbi:hypothetical protein NLU14_08590 [Marinobacter sp. 71-i]|uniref:Scaffolding protein n=1 Tax=Marinobacter iranensis TaxID=2962607 RepID=A0ABT5Y9C7_9GAMM|nr:hypothetical protein [Marinobacter iranensis]MDF0750286.1 hypothetical protein [Marinobacter iranensis]
MADKRLDEYLSNPDEIPTDEESVEEFLRQMGDDGADEASVTDDKDDDDGKKPPEEAEKKPDPEPEKKDDPAEGDDKDDDKAQDEPQSVIKTRDGKHEIPYSVLEAERERVRKLNRELDELKAERERIEEERKQQEKANTQDDSGKSADKDTFDLEAYREEFGDEAAEAEKARREQLHEMRETQKRLEKELTDNRTWREQQEAKAKETAQQEADRLQNEVNEAIDSIPELSKWMNDEDPMWDAAVALDNRLQKDPAFKDYSLKDRFETVVQRLTGKQPAPKTTEDLEKAADEKLAAKEAATRTAPNSLSDLPGGMPADQAESDTLERMTPSQLEAKLAKMSQSEIDEYLSRL